MKLTNAGVNISAAWSDAIRHPNLGGTDEEGFIPEVYAIQGDEQECGWIHSQTQPVLQHQYPEISQNCPVGPSG